MENLNFGTPANEINENRDTDEVISEEAGYTSDENGYGTDENGVDLGRNDLDAGYYNANMGNRVNDIYGQAEKEAEEENEAFEKAWEKEIEEARKEAKEKIDEVFDKLKEKSKDDDAVDLEAPEFEDIKAGAAPAPTTKFDDTMYMGKDGLVYSDRQSALDSFKD